MSDQQSFFDKIKGLFSKKTETPEAKKPPPSTSTSTSTSQSVTIRMTALEVIATLTNFGRQHCGDTYKPQVEIEKLFTIGPSTEQSGAREMIEWFMSTSPGLVFMVMPQPGSCQIILAHGPNPPNKGAYLLGLSSVDSQNIPDNVGALRNALDEYVKQEKIVWEDGKWHYRG